MKVIPVLFGSYYFMVSKVVVPAAESELNFVDRLIFRAERDAL